MNDLTTVLTSFRDDLNAAAPPAVFRSYFTTSRDPTCLEHGPAGHAALPFLGKSFTGEGEILRYYNMIGSVLKGKGSNFREEDLLVQVLGAGRATAVWTGDAVWSVVKTGKEWHEAVVWKFEVEKEGGAWKIARWEVWADTLSAYLASQP